MFKIYLAQVKPGQYEASMPWIAELSAPMRGPSPSQLKEELMFRALELIHDRAPSHVMDRLLLPPDNIQVASVYVDIERKIDPNKPTVVLNVVTHVVIGSWDNDDTLHLWIPKIPGLCLALKSTDYIYDTATSFIQQWAEENQLDDLSMLECSYWGKVEEIDVNAGFPAAIRDEEQGSSLGKGRMRRPETLLQVASNLTHRAADSVLPEAYGREKLVEELLAVLTSPRPVNICLVGPPGVGKTSIIYEAVRRAFDLQKAYQTRRDFWETSGDRIIAGMSIIGQWEQRVTTLLEELSERQDVLVAQDLLGLVRAGHTRQGGSNVARFMEPALEQDRFSIIAEANSETYAMARVMAPGFVNKFRRLNVPELNWKDTLSVMTQLVRKIEGEHEEMRFAPDGIENVLTLTRRFYKHEAFPGKAVRLTRQCEMAALRHIHEQEETEERLLIDTSFVAEVFQKQTGLPRAILEPGVGRERQRIQEQIEQRIYGQEDAVKVITSLVLTIEQGLADPDRPLGCLLLVGPSGVGKTETVKALAEQLFGHEDRMIRFDMSEFSTPLATSRLIGTASDPDGELTSKVRLQPFCVILLDEIEKAHSDVHDLLLQVMGDGRLTDAAGRAVDFRNAVIVMTSNLGANEEDHWVGFKSVTTQDRALHYERSAQAFFRPEFFNRIDHVVPYHTLRSDALRRIANRTLRTLLERRGLRQAQVMVDVEESLIEHLIQDALDPRYGARTLARRIERSLIAPLARRLTTHKVEHGLTRVKISIQQGDAVQLDLNVIHHAPPAQSVVQGERGLDVDADDNIIENNNLPWSGRGQRGQMLLNAQQLIVALQDLTRRLAEFDARPEIAEMSAEYQQLLQSFNDPDQQQDMLSSGDLTEQLRQREVVLERYKQVRSRLDGLLDPQNQGVYVFPLAQEIDRRKQRIWSRVVTELDHDLIWLDVQVRSLMTRKNDSATLLVKGLSGPFSGLLDLWLSLLRALDDVFSLDLAFAMYTDEGSWEPLDLGSSHRMSMLAISAEAPGVLALFNTLVGYVWSPRLPSHGQHALILVEHDQRGFSSDQDLLAALRKDEFSWDSSSHFIEFIERDGQIQDLRLQHKLPIPDDRADNMRQLATRLVMERVVLQDDVYMSSSRSGVWHALTAQDLHRNKGGRS